MNKNLYLYICIGIIAVFTIGYFVVANNMSYAFVNNEESFLLERKVSDIKIASLKYVSNHTYLFQDDNVKYITVDDLVEEQLLDADADGKVKNPENPIKTLNNTKIRLIKNDNGYEVKVLI